MLQTTINNIRKYILFLFFVSANFIVVSQEKITSKSYDYSKISNHPRLLLKKGEENTLLNAIDKNEQLKKIHDYILLTAESLSILPTLEYQKNGKRLLHISRQALARLYFFSYRYRVTKEDKYLKRAEKELIAVCNFKDWNPEHFLDIGEMTMAVSIAYDWLYDDLNESTKKTVRKAIIEKAFNPSYDTKNNWFLKATNNWNAVCNAGLVYGALAILEDEKEASIAIIERALQSVKLSLDVFGADGNYPEGPCYWNYGATFQVMLSAALQSALDSDNGLSKTPGFIESSNFMLFSSGTSGEYFNFYDCKANQNAKTSMFWFAKTTNDASLVYKELQNIENGIYTQPITYREERILPNVLIFSKDIALSTAQIPQKKFYSGKGITPVALVRTDWDDAKGIYFGIKGGSATDSHAHMDQGSFVYDIGKNRWAMDFGSQTYETLESKNVDLWNSNQEGERWNVFRYNNLNHNTLSINNQKHNAKARSKIIETYNSSNEKGAKIDVTEVLNLNNELKFAHRKGVVIDDSYLKIEDILETNSKPVSLRWNMVTASKAEIIDDKTIKLTQKEKVLYLKFNSENALKLAIRPSENPEAYQSEFGFKYESYNEKNPGTIMVGFDALIPKKTKVRFSVTFLEENN